MSGREGVEVPISKYPRHKGEYFDRRQNVGPPRSAGQYLGLSARSRLDPCNGNKSTCRIGVISLRGGQLVQVPIGKPRPSEPDIDHAVSVGVSLHCHYLIEARKREAITYPDPGHSIIVRSPDT